MIEQAEQLGFKYSRKGCPCSGTPLIYTTKKDGTLYTLTIWERRNVWQLKSKGYLLATGKAENLTDKIKSLWDL